MKNADELAAALGIHRNTLGQWTKLGRPEGHDVVTTFLWAKVEGFDAKLPRDVQLVRLCQAGARAPGADKAPAEAKVPSELIAVGKELGVDTPNEESLGEEDRILAWQRWQATINGLVDLRAKRRDLIPRDAMRPFLEQLAASVHAADTDLPALMVDELRPLKLPEVTLEAIRTAITDVRTKQKATMIAESHSYARRIVRGDQARPVDHGDE